MNTRIRTKLTNWNRNKIMNRLESWNEAYEPNKSANKHIQPIRIKKQQESTDWNQELMDKTCFRNWYGMEMEEEDERTEHLCGWSKGSDSCNLEGE